MPISTDKHTITALFDTRAYADQAAMMLQKSGIPAFDVTVSPESAGAELDTVSAPRKTGFWASLEELFGGTDDHETYTEGVRRGGTLLTAHVDENHLDKAVEILEQHGSVDLDERENTWRQEGWTGAPVGVSTSSPSTTALGEASGIAMATSAASARALPVSAPTLPPAASAPIAAASVRSTERSSLALDTASTKPAGSATAAVARGAEDVVQVVEERLNVGKRSVSRGKVRLHSYVVETPVSEQVSLHQETVRVDRHAVDRPVAALGADAFKERTIEMEERDEEAVVAKSTRVVEEIGIRKDVSDRTQTIRDSVRSTKVEIEDGRGVKSSGLGSVGDLARLTENMEVVGSDGRHVGTIDHVEGANIKLKRMDPSSGGKHHLIPTSFVASVDTRAVLSKTADEAKKSWTPAG